jgi:hypothetical protein
VATQLQLTNISYHSISYHYHDENNDHDDKEDEEAEEGKIRILL